MGASRISSSRLNTLLGLALLGATACSSESEVPEPSTSSPAAGGTASEGSSSGGTAGANAQASGGTNADPLPVPASCATRELPSRSGKTVTVEPAGPGLVKLDEQETTLRAVIAAAEEGDTILLAAGTYTFAPAEPDGYSGLYVTTPHVTIRGATGDASDVILDSGYVDHGGQSGVISVDAPDVVLAHFTVQTSIFHLIHFWEQGDDSLVHNVVLKDGGQQFLKASPSSGTVDGVEISCSRFLMTSVGRANVWGYGDATGNTRCYTGGIDTHNATNWHIHDSNFDGIYCDTQEGRPAHGKKGDDRGNMTYTGGLAEHAIHMWDSAEGSSHLIERNFIKDCARGIGLGLRDPVYGSIIRNNVITSAFAASGEHDVALSVERGVNTLVAHNTIFGSHEAAYPHSIEVRWNISQGVEVYGNLISHELKLRDDATATLSHNINTATASTFVDAATDDFHLATCSAAEVPAHSQVPTDLDAVPRREPSSAGAFECGE